MNFIDLVYLVLAFSYYIIYDDNHMFTIIPNSKLTLKQPGGRLFSQMLGVTSNFIS